MANVHEVKIWTDFFNDVSSSIPWCGRVFFVCVVCEKGGRAVGSSCLRSSIGGAAVW
jgi:hypothetical protein